MINVAEDSLSQGPQLELTLILMKGRHHLALLRGLDIKNDWLYVSESIK